MSCGHPKRQRNLPLMAEGPPETPVRPTRLMVNIGLRILDCVVLHRVGTF